MKIILNPDQEIVKEVKESLEANDYYCPCKLTHLPENKCMCKDFREQTIPGFCHCKRFMKVETEDKKDA